MECVVSFILHYINIWYSCKNRRQKSKCTVSVTEYDGKTKEMTKGTTEKPGQIFFSKHKNL